MPPPADSDARGGDAPRPAGPGGRLPLLFLDVDGVLNPYAWRAPAPEAFDDFVEHQARGFCLRLSPQMGHRLHQLPAEIRWATTWSDTVDDDIAPVIGLPVGLAVAARPPIGEAEALANWKFVQVRAVVERERRAFVWLDDDALDWPAPDGQTPRQWAAELDLPNLLLAPRPELGLTLGELESISSFLYEIVAAHVAGQPQP